MVECVQHGARDRKQIACPHGEANEAFKVLAGCAWRPQKGLHHAQKAETLFLLERNHPGAEAKTPTYPLDLRGSLKFFQDKGTPITCRNKITTDPKWGSRSDCWEIK